jgi:hypothetical protein
MAAPEQDERAERQVVVRAPPGTRGRRIVVAGSLWIALQIAIPLRYYLGDDVHDERFAWRMFSAVRVQQCAVTIREVDARGEQALTDDHLYAFLPAPWISLLERTRPAVVDRYLRWRCDREGMRSIRFENACHDASGDPLPAIVREIECGTGRIGAPE